MPGDKIEMTPDELQAKITAAVTAAVEKLQGKNTELLTELKTVKKKAEAFGDLDPDQVRKAVELANSNAAKALADKGEYQKALDLATENHKQEMAKLTDKFNQATSSEKKLRATVALDAAMDEAKVAPAYRNAVKAMHLNDITVIEKDGKPLAVVGDKPVADHLKAWAGSDEGKYFVGDPGAGGGGAGGGKKTGGQVNPWAKETRNLTEQGLLEKNNPSLASQLKQEAGASA